MSSTCLPPGFAYSSPDLRNNRYKHRNSPFLRLFVLDSSSLELTMLLRRPSFSRAGISTPLRNACRSLSHCDARHRALCFRSFEETRMQSVENLISGIIKGICFSVEHMSVTQWCILGTTSVVLGFLCLRSTKY
jgi:hypothetical protein